MNFNVNFNILLSKYIVHPLVKIKKDFSNETKLKVFGVMAHVEQQLDGKLTVRV